ncbi:MAG: hypothetical protein ABIP94_20745, partial [Planctomycetota bacterium]
MASPAGAQVPHPFTSNAATTRRVHPAIADPAPGAVRNGTSPMFAYADTTWNHGEGFAPGTQSDADYGGWFMEDNGTNLTAADIHTDPTSLGNVPNPWSSFTWTNALHPNGGAQMRRFYGYLRPAGLLLPNKHPLYGSLGQNYVDQGAFEMFCPTVGPGPSRKIVIGIQTQATAGFPLDYLEQGYGWGQIYRGIFSPDGLVRNEKGPTRSAANFVANDNPIDRLGPQLIATWPDFANPSYWPIAAYPVLTVPGRQTTLNEQRYMQVLQAVILLLQENSVRNPLYAYPNFAPLTLTDIQQRVVVVFAGSSNGGHQAMWAMMRYPERVHGCYAEFINPSIQRLFGEHDAGNLTAWLTGDAGTAKVTQADFLNWGQYTWNHDLWIHDLSYQRRFLRGRTHRPACWGVGDEDLTSTGVDWISVLTGGVWQASGSVSSSAYGSPAAHTFAWMSAKNACHGRGAATNPYTSSLTYHMDDAVHGLIEHAVAQRATELPVPPTTLPSWAAEPRQLAQELKHPEDPHEWVLGRLGETMPDT